MLIKKGFRVFIAFFLLTSPAICQPYISSASSNNKWYSIKKQLQSNTLNLKEKYKTSDIQEWIGSGRLNDENILFEQGVKLYQNRKNLESIKKYREALEIYYKHNNLFGVGRTLNAIGLSYFEMDKYSEALIYCQRSLSIFKEIGIPARAGKALNNIGRIYDRVGQFQKALESYELALSIFEKANDQMEQGNALNNIGLVHLEQDQYSLAVSFLLRALVIRREVKDQEGEVKTLYNIGNSYTLTGQYEQALNFYQEAFNVSKRLTNFVDQGNILINMGALHFQKQQYSKAVEFYQKALNIFISTNSRLGEGRVLNNLGNTYRLTREYAKSYDALSRSLQITQNLGDRYFEGKVLDSLGSLYKAQKQNTRALEHYQRSLLVSQTIGDRASERITLSNLGDLLTEQDQPEIAILFYKQSVNVTESIRKDLRPLPKAQQESYVQTVADTYRKLADLLLQQNRVLEAQQVLELLKVQELDDYLRNVRGVGQQVEFLRPEEEILAKYKAIEKNAIQLGKELGELEKLARSSTLSPQEQQRKAELVQLQTDINRQFNEFLRSGDVQQLVQKLRVEQPQALNPDQFNRLQDDLKRLSNAVLLYPLVLDDRLELILTTPYSPPVRRVIKVTRKELYSAILEFRQALKDPTRDAKPVAQKLYNWLILPVEPLLKEAKAQTIIYAPDDQLRYIPLAALHTGKQWLVEQYRINNITAQSLTDFAPIDQTPHRVLAGAFATGSYTVSVGDRTLTFSGLPFTAREVDFLSKNLANTTKLLDRAFTRSAVQVNANTSDIIHLATHAVFVKGSPEDSFILFGDGSFLRLREIPDWTLKDVQLVVLSACETGVGGQFGTGVEILGLGYQFQRAGARAAIASLWTVDDGGTEALMTAFYEQLKLGKVTKAEALRQAQIALINANTQTTGVGKRSSIEIELLSSGVSQTTINRLNHPYYWAPFILIGNGL